MSPIRRRPQRYPRHGLLLITISTMLLQLPCSQEVYGFSLPETTRPNAKSHSSSFLAASREVLPNTSSSASPLSSCTTSKAEDPPWSAVQTTVPSLVAVLSLCLVSAVAVVAWEDYGASNLWPSRRMIVESTTTTTPTTTVDSSSFLSSAALSRQFGARTVHGLAYGKGQRLQSLAELKQQQPSESGAANPLLPDIKSYNEIGQEHREERVTRWKTSQRVATTSNQQLEEAVRDLQQVLRDILKLETLAADYQWQDMHAIIQSSMVPKLEPAATTLRWHLMHTDIKKNVDSRRMGYEDVGFDWGSCAWRHCGALADAQEALDELDHLLGVLEPPECLFCLNVAERSLRDILAAVPTEYHAEQGIPEYIAYQSAHSSGGEDGDDEMDVLDQDYLRMLKELRNSNDGATSDDIDD